MPAKRAYGMDQDFYPWSPIVTRPIVRWPDNARVALAVIVNDRHPKVRDGVLLCAGAKVLGNVEIGRDAKVGAGSVVLHDVPPRATVAGVPARIVGWSSGSVPALEMDQSLPDYEI